MIHAYLLFPKHFASMPLTVAKCCNQIGLLDLVKISYKLTINMSSYLQEYIQYHVDYTHTLLIFFTCET